MAAATVTSKGYGYRITGDTGEATVSTGKLYIKQFIFTNHAASETATIKDAAGNAVMIIVPDTVIAGVQTVVEFDAYLDGLMVTLSHGSAVLIVTVA